MINRKQLTAIVILACLLLWLPAVAGATGVTILEPTNISVVPGPEITVNGTVNKPPGVNFYVGVYTPQRVWWVYAPTIVDNGGRWQAKVNLGDFKNGNNGQYSICAFLTPATMTLGRQSGNLPKPIVWHTVIVKRQDAPPATVKITQPTADSPVRNPVDVRGTVTKPATAGLYVAVMPQSGQEWLIQGQPELTGDQWRLAVNLGDAKDPAGKYWVRAFLTASELKKGDRFASGKLPGVLAADELGVTREPEESPFGSWLGWLGWLGGIAATVASGIAVKLFEGRIGSRGSPPPHG